MKNFILLWSLISIQPVFATLGSSTNRNDYTGDGSANTYTYAYKIFVNTELLVTVQDTDDDETTLVLSTDYTVTGVTETSGGSIVLVNSSQAWLDGGGDLKTNFKLTIRRNVPLTQETDIRNQGPYFPATHEDTFDFLTMIDQQQQDQIDRSLKLPETIAGSTFSTLLSPPLTADFILGVNAAGDGFEVKAASTFAFDDAAPNTTKGDIITHDGADNIRLGVGTDTQLLSSNSAASSGIQWVTINIESVTPTTTKGDLIVDDGTSAIRLAIGSDGFILKADSGETGGMKWDSEGILTVATKTISYTATTADNVLIFDTSINAVLTLFTASSNTGRVLNIENISNVILTISLIDNQTLDGETSQELFLMDSVNIITDGSNWFAF